jgi:hypothetical protein
MTKKIKIKLFIYFIGFVMPILGILNCKGFNEGSMEVTHCFIDSNIIRSYANFYNGWLGISSFFLFIPIIIYIIVVIKIANFFS